MAGVRNLVLVLGDQLDHQSAAFDGFENGLDLVWMAEVKAESTHVWSNKVRSVMFLSGMRHFARELAEKGRRCSYRALLEDGNRGDFAGELNSAIERFHPERIVVVEPGECRVGTALKAVANEAAVPYSVRPDRHFFCATEEFREYARERKQLRMEFFYREMRRRANVLMDGEYPAGGKWNYDVENRGSFGKQGPGVVPVPCAFPPDAITRQVIEEVEQAFPDHPGDLSTFQFPVTQAEARIALHDFISKRLAVFGQYQDAMWIGAPFLFHSRISAALNLKLLNPRTVVDAAEREYREGRAPLAAVEGFIRQILGWREYVRGIYWTYMPEYGERNALNAHEPLPDFYWTGNTEMACLREALGQTLRFGYAHHIQRLMVTGLYSLLLGVHPRAIHEWYLAVYVDAVEWVELPNVIGMSQFADGGLMGSKPYVATGKYIQRMSNYCSHCPYDPAKSTGETACPFTTLYWDFLLRHEEYLRTVPRMEMQLRNLRNLKPQTRRLVQIQAESIRVGKPQESRQLSLIPKTQWTCNRSSVKKNSRC